MGKWQILPYYGFLQVTCPPDFRSYDDFHEYITAGEPLGRGCCLLDWFCLYAAYEGADLAMVIDLNIKSIDIFGSVRGNKEQYLRAVRFRKG